jgi:hypothetical protein
VNEAPYLLTCRRLPARVDADGAASILGFQTHDITILIGQKLLKPLGKPSAKSVKYFSTAELVTLASDRSWLDKATKTISETWQERNESRKTGPLNSDDSRAP